MISMRSVRAEHNLLWIYMKQSAKEERLLKDTLRESVQLGYSIYNTKHNKEEEEPKLGEEAEQILRTLPNLPEGRNLGTVMKCVSETPSEEFHIWGLTYLKDKKRVTSGPLMSPSRVCNC